MWHSVKEHDVTVDYISFLKQLESISNKIVNPSFAELTVPYIRAFYQILPINNNLSNFKLSILYIVRLNMKWFLLKLICPVFSVYVPFAAAVTQFHIVISYFVSWIKIISNYLQYWLLSYIYFLDKLIVSSTKAKEIQFTIQCRMKKSSTDVKWGSQKHSVIRKYIFFL